MALKCVKCGAPIAKPSGEFEYIVCDFCNYTQKILDSQQYVERLRGEIFRWISEMVPPSAITTEVADVVARHNLFVFNVKPRISSDHTHCRSKLSMLTSNPLIHLPFYSTSKIRLEEEPKMAFERLARIEGLSPLVVVDEDQTFFSEVKISSSFYAYLLNALSLVRDKAEISFVIKNLEVIPSYLSDKKVEHNRIIATIRAYEAMQLLIRGDPKAAKIKADESLTLLKKARDEAKLPQTAFMIPSIEKDIHNVEAVMNLVAASSMYTESGREPNEFLAKMERFFKYAEGVREEKNLDTDIYNEITGAIKDIVAAKTGFGQIHLLPGGGSLIIPMWVVSITYSFETGALFMKKGKAVNDVVMVSAVPASQPVSDVFLLRSTSSFIDRVKGKETTMSKGVLSDLVANARSSSVQWHIKVLPPITTRDQAIRHFEKYIEEVSRRTKGKVKFGTGKVERLVFLPAEVRGGEAEIPALADAPVTISPYLSQLLEVAI
jgi:hypothetical protein